MARQKVPWRDLRIEYIQAPVAPTAGDLAKRHSIGVGTVASRMALEKWTQEREEYTKLALERNREKSLEFRARHEATVRQDWGKVWEHVRDAALSILGQLPEPVALPDGSVVQRVSPERATILKHVSSTLNEAYQGHFGALGISPTMREGPLIEGLALLIRFEDGRLQDASTRRWYLPDGMPSDNGDNGPASLPSPVPGDSASGPA